MYFASQTTSFYYIVFIYCFCCCCHVSCYSEAVSADERKEIDTASEILQTVEKRLVKKIHEKYAKKEEQQRQTWENLKSTLEGFVELEKRKLYSDTANYKDGSVRNSHRENSNVPRIPHREMDVPRIPHREIDSPRIPHREVDIPRVPHRDVDIPRVPHREVNTPRIPHREVAAQPRVPHDAPRVPHMDFLRQAPRVPHRDFQEVPRVPHRDFQQAPRVPHRDFQQAPRVPHKDQVKAPRVPHRDFLSNLIKSSLSDSASSYHQLKLSDLEKDLLREMASASATGASIKNKESHREMTSSTSGITKKKDRELQDRSEECVSACMGIFDTCLHSIESEELFKSCLDLKRSCIENHSSCI